MISQVPPGWHSYSGQRDESLYVIGRLKPGVSLAQATPNINLLFQQVWLSYRDEHVTQKDLADLQKTHVPLTSIANGLNALRDQFSQP